jgi:hypothetical protein
MRLLQLLFPALTALSAGGGAVGADDGNAFALPAIGTAEDGAVAELLAAPPVGWDLEIIPPRPPVHGPADRRLVDAVRHVLELAWRRLQRPECADLFEDFQDGRGRGLADKLRDIGVNGQTYLRWLIFYNADYQPYCLDGRIAAASSPGGRVVLLCPGQFLRIYRQDPLYAAALVIHEELHALGLHENPPSSGEITRRVLARCWSKEVAR